MRKGLTIFGILSIILIVFCTAIFPTILKGTIETQLKKSLASNDVTVNVSAQPAFLLALGHMDHLEVVAHDAMIGDAVLSEVRLDGRSVQANFFTFFREGKLAAKAAEKFLLTAYVTEENLQTVLAHKNERLENIAVKIERDKVTVTAQAKIFGRMADLLMEGIVLEDAGNLYFRMTHLTVKNALRGKIQVEDFFDDIRLAGAEQLPFGTKFSSVAMCEGKIILMAEKKK